MAVSRALAILKKEEQILTKAFERQISGIRSAISSLTMGSAISPGIRLGRPVGSKNAKPVRKRRKLSAKARAAISKAQKARWAKLKADKKK